MSLAPSVEVGSPVFTTRELALRSNVSVSSASHRLARAAESGAIVQVTRGVWADPKDPRFHPHLCVAKLLGNEQGYVSFLTALHLHGLVSQIPRRIHVATTGHGRRVATPVGTFELFQIAPHLMRRGVDWSETAIPYRIATPEKALFDTLYVSTRRGRRFRSLPEVDLSRRRFSRARWNALLRDLDDRRTVSAVTQRLQELLERGADA